MTGVDVAASMVEGAQARNAFPDRVSYVVNTAPTLPFDDATFDFAYSILVLQHIPPKAAAGYISELVRVLAARAAWSSFRSSRIGRRPFATRCCAPSRMVS